MAFVNGRGFGRFLLGVLLLIVVVGVAGGIGSGIYNQGVADGIAQAERVPAGATVPVAGSYGFHGFGWGFGFLGLLFPLFFLFLIFGLVRAAFGGRRWGGGYGGYGWGKGGWGRWSGPEADAWRQERDRQMGELHRRLHEQESGGSGTSGPTGSTGSPGGTGVA
jgi:hypothetical protein